MGHGADLGTQLAADHALIEMLADQYELESDPERRRALAGQVAAAVARHMCSTTRLLCEGVVAYAPEHDDEMVHMLLAQARDLLRTEQKILLPALERAVAWQVLEDLGARARDGHGHDK